jgi:Fe-S-cluster-containing dehydrogenase component
LRTTSPGSKLERATFQLYSSKAAPVTYAFTFDATFCSGCKACQAACKDKNDLPTGLLWRRVVEVSGGAWQQEGDAWKHSVFAYNLSMSCNHCVHPKCAGVCPVDAFILREDGIVFSILQDAWAVAIAAGPVPMERLSTIRMPAT